MLKEDQCHTVLSSTEHQVLWEHLQIHQEHLRINICQDIWELINKTVLNLEVVKVIAEKNLILIKGGIPGPNKGTVVIRNTVKA